MAGHVWKFFRAGGFDQVQLETGADLMRLDELDLKLWVALACPTSGLEFSEETARLVDLDGDGRIRASELIAAVKWAGSRLRDPDELVKGGDTLALDAIADPVLQAAARQVCASLARPGATTLTVDDASDANRIFAGTTLNGDGVVLPESTDDPDLQSVLRDIAGCTGTVQDRSGRPGVDRALVEAFFADLEAFDRWHREAEADAALLPLGQSTASAADAVRAVRTKVDDFFGRCRLAAYDPRALASLNRREEEYLELAARDLTITASEIADFPIARVAPGRDLPLGGDVSPAYEAAVRTLRAAAVGPMLGDRESLTEADWRTLKSRLSAYEAWLARKPLGRVETLGPARVRDLLDGAWRDRVHELIAKDLTLEPEARAIADVRRLLLYKRDLYLLCTNFVNFRDFYDSGEPAIFQAGTLYLDQRSCTLTLPVEDSGRHASMAAMAGSYLAYCDVVRKGSGEKRQIVAAFTNGDADNLMVGRNGVFYDRKGRDWDATITRIVENPISIRQAFWSPYKKLLRMIEEQVAKRAAAADAESHSRLESTAVGVAHTDKTPPKLEPKKIDVGTVAAMGVAFGAIATAFAALAGYLSGLLKLPFWQVCLAVTGLMMLVSGPSMAIAWLKLRKRNLGPILDANGWAVNAKARLNVPFGASLTGVAKLPVGFVMSSREQFREKPSLWPKLLMLAVIAGFLFSLLNHFYVLDAIHLRLTGTHNSAWFRVPPTSGTPARTP